MKRKPKDIYNDLKAIHTQLEDYLLSISKCRQDATYKLNFFKKKISGKFLSETFSELKTINSLNSEIECYDYQISKLEAMIANVEESLGILRNNLIILQTKIQPTEVEGYEE